MKNPPPDATIRLLVGAFAFAIGVSSAPPAKSQSEAAAEREAFHARVASLYSFEPHTLSSAQIDAKSALLDVFWDEVKQDTKKNLQLLRSELRDASHSAFFFYDGSKLLLAISKEREDRELALEAIPRADLRGIQPTDYVRTVHWFAANGFDTTTAALRILDYPDFKAFIAQHALTLGQDYALIYMLFPMPEGNYVRPLVERLKIEHQPESQKSILLALWYSMTPEGRDAAGKFIADSSRPQQARNYARELRERTAPTSPVTSLTVPELKEQRRQVMMRSLSDEALHEFDSLTAELLARQ